MFACFALAAFAAPAFAQGLGGRNIGANQVFNPSNPDMQTTYTQPDGTTIDVKNIGSIFSDRAGQNASINITDMNQNHGMSIPATPQQK
jgi:hypothetical protein